MSNETFYDSADEDVVIRSMWSAIPPPFTVASADAAISEALDEYDGRYTYERKRIGARIVYDLYQNDVAVARIWISPCSPWPKLGLRSNYDDPAITDLLMEIDQEISDNIDAFHTLRELLEQGDNGDNMAKNGGGRPRNVDDDWAWEQINELGCNRSEVFEKWLTRIDPQRKQDLADPRDSFNKAVSPRRRKKLEKTE